MAEDGRPHLVPCVCTVDSRTGAVVDYDCGRAIDDGRPGVCGWVCVVVDVDVASGAGVER
ncbi:Uncharacterised protein [Mycolicibacterium vanbaalenii]|uniref:Uncharacterized protein n=1 Tax=Mycolicibacterium vanbaalenii TaxID=110539 RepID=A0A5S9R8H6_MYCVN|nr:hypothetical protein [Mycolicibacterium vanbaalenii]CAA0136364.1 Uncharacterised protein [Mycolicibacterium vanbaalenii]